MEQTFPKDWRRYAPGSLRVHKTKNNVRPEDGDLVLVKGDKMGDMGHYGVVAKVLSPQTIRCRLRDGSEFDKPANLVVPLVANCLLD